MYKLISSQYQGKCGKCGNPYFKGDAIYWERGKQSPTFHARCYKSEPAPRNVTTVPVDKTTGMVPFNIDVSELKALMIRAIAGDVSFLKMDGNRSRLRDQIKRSETDDGWRGFTNSELESWIKTGYKSEVFQDMHDFSPPLRKRRKMIYADEGEMQIDLAMSGFDMPFTQWTKQDKVPGLSIDVRLDFSGSTSGATVVQYERFVARMLYTLESEGIDLDVNVILGTMGSSTVSHRKYAVKVSVKRENEASDFARWAVMVSPAGLRGMLFLAVILACDKSGEVCNSGYGQPVSPDKWDMVFQPETRKLTVECPKSPREFPESDMSEKLRTVISQFH
jgi:hypothetical protein